MSLELTTTLQYEIKNLTIITGYGNYDLRKIFLEMNIFDHILQPCMSGNILINDGVSLSSKLDFDGSEFLYLEITKGDDSLPMKKMFRIYKQTDRKKVNMTSENYILHFVSDEFLFSEQQTLNNSYNGSYSEMAQLIMENKLGITADKYFLERSVGVRNIIVPNLKPLDALIWCSKRALNNLQLPNFLFYENFNGYNFLSLSTLKSQDAMFDVYFEPKKISASIGREFFGARDYEIISQFDYLDSIQSGVYSGTFIGFDPITRFVVEQHIQFDDIFKDKKLNKEVNFTKEKTRDGASNIDMKGTRRVVFPTPIARENTQYIKDNDITSLNLNETPQFFVFQRKAILKQLFAQRLKVSLPGNFLLTSGRNLNLKKQKNSTFDEESNDDKSVFGKYLIVAARHIIKTNSHETLIEVATDSNIQTNTKYSVDVKRMKI